MKIVRMLLAAYWLVTWVQRTEFKDAESNYLGKVAVEERLEQKFESYDRAIQFIRARSTLINEKNAALSWGFRLHRFEERQIPWMK